MYGKNKIKNVSLNTTNYIRAQNVKICKEMQKPRQRLTVI